MHRSINCLAVLAALAAGSACFSQTTRPAAEPAPMISVWTCDTHGQFRMSAKGECPICEKPLTRRKVEAAEPYPLDTCPVSSLELSAKGAPIIMMYEDREIRFCCKGCVMPFQKKSAELLEMIDKKIIEQQLPYYPMMTCPVSEEPLTAMGEPVNLVYNNRLVRLCCNGCKKGFKKDPATYLATLDAAVITQQKPHYPFDTCPISGQKLGSMGDPVDVVVSNLLVRFCCAGCIGMFYQAPAAHLDNLKKAWADSHADEGDIDHGHDHDHDHDHGHDHDHDHGH